jgi:tetratricopeptide (TPR) repeat protein
VSSETKISKFESLSRAIPLAVSHLVSLVVSRRFSFTASCYFLISACFVFVFSPSAYGFDKTKWMDVKREGQNQENSGHYATAEKYYRESMRIAKDFPSKSSERIETCYHIANILVLQGKYWEAEVFYQKLVMVVQEQKRDKTLDQEVLVWMEDLADSYGHAIHGWLEYLALEHAVQLRDIISGDENRYMAVTLRKLVTVLLNEAKYAEADPYANRLVRVTKKLTGKGELVKAADLFLLSLIQYHQGKYAKAESNLREALTLYTKMEIPPGFCTGNTLVQLAKVLQCQNQFELAEQSAVRALKIFDRTKGKNWTGSIQPHEILKDLYRRTGRYAEAAKENEQLISIMVASQGPSNAYMPKLYKEQKELYLKSKNPTKAREIDKKMSAISKQTNSKSLAHGH